MYIVNIAYLVYCQDHYPSLKSAGGRVVQNCADRVSVAELGIETLDVRYALEGKGNGRGTADGVEDRG